MARNLLTVIFLFLFVLPVYAGKPTAPAVVTLPATNITANTATLSCSVQSGSEIATAHINLYKGTIYIGGYEVSGIAPSTSFVNVPMPVSGLLSDTVYTYNCIAWNSVGSVWGEEVTFSTLSSSIYPPACSLTADHSSVAAGSPVVITYMSGFADTFTITYPNTSMSVTPNIQGSFSDSPIVTTTYTGTATNGAGSTICPVTVTVGNVPPQSVTVGATPLPSYNGFEFNCSNMLGTTPTRLFMRMTANGITKDYNYVTVPSPGTFTEFWGYSPVSYDMYTEAIKPSPFIPLILDMNTLYQYQCCSENSFGSSCGDTGSIYTAPYALSFNYDFAPDWPRSVSYGAKSLWTLTINNVRDAEICTPCHDITIYYLASDNTIQNRIFYDLFYSYCPGCPPAYNCCSTTGTQSCSDSFRWDCFPKDGILDDVDVISGLPICAVFYKDGYEHFQTCPSSGNIQGKPLYAASYVGGLPGTFSGACCPPVPFPFGNAFFAADAQSKGKSAQSKGRVSYNIGKSSNRRGVVGEIFR